MALWPFGKTLDAPGPRANARCSFCCRAKSLVGPMVEGPDGAFICADCVRAAARVADANCGNAEPAALGPGEWRSAHMMLVLYVRAEQGADGRWTATASVGDAVAAEGTTAAEAVRRLQANVLASTAERLSEDADVGAHFSNHLDEWFRGGALVDDDDTSKRGAE